MKIMDSGFYPGANATWKWYIISNVYQEMYQVCQVLSEDYCKVPGLFKPENA